MDPADFANTRIGSDYLKKGRHYEMDLLLDFYNGIKNWSDEEKQKAGIKDVANELEAIKEIFILETT